MDYILHLGILICIYTILAQSLSLVAGYSGQISLAHAGFYGIGAYVTALLSVNFGWSVVFTLPLAMLISGVDVHFLNGSQNCLENLVKYHQMINSVYSFLNEIGVFYISLMYQIVVYQFIRVSGYKVV